MLEISPHDPYIQFAADTAGYAYWSNTKGEIWHAVEGIASVRDFLFAQDYPWIVFAATASGVYRSLDGGLRWTRTLNQPIDALLADPINAHVLYAIGRSGVYRSEDLGEREMGTLWHRISGETPPGGSAVYALDLQGSRLYRLTRHSFATRGIKDSEWQAAPPPKRVRGFSTVDPLGGRPLWLRADPSVEGRLFRAVETQQRGFPGVLVSVSDDGGRSWSPVLRELKVLTDWAAGNRAIQNITQEDLRRLIGRLQEFSIRDVRVDRQDPNTWYGLMERGVAVTRDAGRTWSVSNAGLDIPAWRRFGHRVMRRW